MAVFTEIDFLLNFRGALYVRQFAFCRSVWPLILRLHFCFLGFVFKTSNSAS